MEHSLVKAWACLVDFESFNRTKWSRQRFPWRTLLSLQSVFKHVHFCNWLFSVKIYKPQLRHFFSVSPVYTVTFTAQTNVRNSVVVHSFVVNNTSSTTYSLLSRCGHRWLPSQSVYMYIQTKFSASFSACFTLRNRSEWSLATFYVVLRVENLIAFTNWHKSSSMPRQSTVIWMKTSVMQGRPKQNAWHAHRRFCCHHLYLLKEPRAVIRH